jgi:hypothetical protein
MTDEAMSPLRRRRIEDMAIRKLAPKTQQGYIRIVKELAASRGLLPWRFADAGPGKCAAPSSWAGIRKPSH